MTCTPYLLLPDHRADSALRRPDIHLSAFVDHPMFARTKPEPTQRGLQKAIRESGLGLCEVRNSQTATGGEPLLIQLQLSKDGYHVRSSRQACSIASNADSQEDMDSRTVYVVRVILLRRLYAHFVLNTSGTASFIPGSQCPSFALSPPDILEAAVRSVAGARSHIETPSMGVCNALLRSF